MRIVTSGTTEVAAVSTGDITADRIAGAPLGEAIGDGPREGPGDVMGDVIGVAMGDVKAGAAAPPAVGLAFDDAAVATAADAPRAPEIAFGARLLLPPESPEPPSLALAGAAMEVTLEVPLSS